MRQILKLGKFMGPYQRQHLSALGSVMGSPYVTSPEMHNEGQLVQLVVVPASDCSGCEQH